MKWSRQVRPVAAGVAVQTAGQITLDDMRQMPLLPNSFLLEVLQTVNFGIPAKNTTLSFLKQAFVGFFS